MMKARRRTGAPTAHFLSALTSEIPLHPAIIAGSRKQRESLASLSTSEITHQMWYELIELASRVSRPPLIGSRLDDAASGLAAVAASAAKILQSLTFSDDRNESEMILRAARRKNFWPVLLSLGVKRKKGRQLSTILKGADKAKDYLTTIELGKQAESGIQHLDDRDASVFKKAAELLLNRLLHWREHDAWRGKPTPWSRRLLSLDCPMTSANVGKWWNLAKQWMDETWEANHDLFEPLVRACSVKGKPLSKAGLFGSEVKARVIDLRLKEAFYSLAKPGDM